MENLNINPFENQKHSTKNQTQEQKTEHEIVTPEFLQEQIRLPKDQWNEEFSLLVEEKIKENQREINNDYGRETEESLEALQECTFERYMEGLGLSEESLRGKRILDLGSGDGEFVESLIEKKITSEAYGLDMEIDESLVEKKFKNHIIQGSFEEDLPVSNCDYIVSVGAVSNGIWGGKEEMRMARIIEKSLASLKEDGEIRIYPIQEAAQATPLKGIQASQEKWKELIVEISQAQKIECVIEPRDIRVFGIHNDIILESVLIIRREKNQGV